MDKLDEKEDEIQKLLDQTKGMTKSQFEEFQFVKRINKFQKELDEAYDELENV